MNEFIAKHQKRILGVLSGFDRVRFRGTFRVLAVAKLLMSWLAHQRVLIKDFGGFAETLTQRLKGSVEEVARQCLARRGVVRRPGEPAIQFLRSPKISKEDLVADQAASAERRRQSGPVTRLLRLFRAHGLIQKIPRTHRYQLTANPPRRAEFSPPSPQREPRVHKHLAKSPPKIFSRKQNFQRLQSRGETMKLFLNRYLVLRHQSPRVLLVCVFLPLRDLFPPACRRLAFAF